jgi:hypothetical protein
MLTAHQQARPATRPAAPSRRRVRPAAAQALPPITHHECVAAAMGEFLRRHPITRASGLKPLPPRRHKQGALLLVSKVGTIRSAGVRSQTGNWPEPGSRHCLRNLAATCSFVVGVAGFEPAASSSRTRFLRSSCAIAYHFDIATTGIHQGTGQQFVVGHVRTAGPLALRDRLTA